MLCVRLYAGRSRPGAGEVELVAPLGARSGAPDGWSLAPISEDSGRAAVERVQALLVALAAANRDRNWWYLPVAECQPFMSLIPQAIEIEAHLLATAARARLPGALVFAVGDGLLAAYLLRRFDRHPRVALHASLRDRFRWSIDRAKNPLRRWFNALTWLTAQLRHLASTAAAGASTPLPAAVDTVFVTRFEAELEHAPPPLWSDRYLGDLPDVGDALTGSVALLGRCGGHPGRIAATVSRFHGFPILTIHQLVSVRHLLSALGAALRVRLRYAGDDPLGALAVAESRNHVQALAECVLVEKAISAFLKHCRARQVVCMQENGAWEHAVVHGVQRARTGTRGVGIFHCPVMPVSLRYHCSAETFDQRPVFPDTVPLGSAMAAALERLGPWGSRLRPGYAFRNPDIDACLGLTPASRRGSEFVLLVLLGGNFDDGMFLRWVVAARRALPAHRLVVKGHPVFGAARALAHAGVDPETAPDIEEFVGVSMVDALRNAHCVVYKGTTAGLSALAAGVPVVHVDHGGLLSDDTLFDAGDLGNSVSTAPQFRAAVERVMNWSEDERRAWARDARGYASRYYDTSESSRERALAWLFPDRVGSGRVASHGGEES